MKNQNVIITGASTGIGKAIAKLFLDKGHQLIMNSANENNLRQTYEEFGSPSKAVIVAGDVSDPKTGEKLLKAAIDNFGSVDVLVNNAGIFAPKPFLEVEEKDIDKYLEHQP